jgi:hypothetical protein
MAFDTRPKVVSKIITKEELLADTPVTNTLEELEINEMIDIINPQLRRAKAADETSIFFRFYQKDYQEASIDKLITDLETAGYTVTKEAITNRFDYYDYWKITMSW